MPSPLSLVTTALLVVGVLAGVEACTASGERRTAEFGPSSEPTSEPTSAPPSGATPDNEARPPISELPTGTVSSIVDGDTLRLVVDGRELRVRLTGIDTPEVYPDVECYGPEATEALATYAPVGSTLAFEYDVEQRDQYGRELMYLYTLDGQFINYLLVREGYATELHYQPNTRYRDLILDSEQFASEVGLGLWGSC